MLKQENVVLSLRAFLRWRDYTAKYDKIHKNEEKWEIRKKICMLYNVWGHNFKITCDNGLNILSPMINEEIPYLELTFTAFKGPFKSAIYHMKILTQHEMAPHMF